MVVAEPERRSMRSLFWSVLCPLVLAACTGTPAQPATEPKAAEPMSVTRFKVRVPAAQAQRLHALAPDATVLADYGAFQLVQVRQAAVDKVSALPGAARVTDDAILLNTGAVDPHTAAAQALRAARSVPTGKALRLVQFVGPVQPAWHQALEATGVRVVSYIPHNAYLVWGNADTLKALQHLIDTDPKIQWDADYSQVYKLTSAVRTAAADAYELQLVKDATANAATLAKLNALGGREPEVTSSPLGYLNVLAHVSRAQAIALAAQPDVVSIHPHRQSKTLDERQDMIVAGQLPGAGYAHGYLDWLAAKGFTQAQFDASGFGVDITDSGFDNGTLTPYQTNFYLGGDPANASRVVYQRDYSPAFPGEPTDPNNDDSYPVSADCAGHGTFVASIVGGFAAQTGSPYLDSGGFERGLGIAPFVRLGGTSIATNCEGSLGSSPERTVSTAYASGMRITNNSWGSDPDPDEGYYLPYTSEAQLYDALVRDAQPEGSLVPAEGNQEMVVVFAAGNEGTAPMTIGSPALAKNVIAVGATEVPGTFPGADFGNVAYFSAAGPTSDGRTKPDLMAPGYAIAGDEVLDAPGAGFSLGGGTSYSAPAVSGGAALLRQDFINQGLPPPSPAMTKAFLMNSARYLTGNHANDPLPSNAQGVGLMDLDRAFDRVSRLLDDQSPASLFTATGQVRTFTGAIVDPTQPVRVTLAWTDAPGPTDAAAWVNDLDLAVTVDAGTYLGNVFSGPLSIQGGAADQQNNVESVYLPEGTTGPFTITVTAANIAGDGVPKNATPLDQDFALVAYNVCGSQPTFSGLESVSDDAASTCGATLHWSAATPVCGGTVTYSVYRSTDPGFTPSFANRIASGLTGASYDDQNNLVDQQSYSYVVRAVEGFAAGEVEDANTTVKAVSLQGTTGGCTTAASPPGPAVSLTLQGLASPATALTPASFELRAVDVAGVQTTGDVALSSSDPNAELPAPVSLLATGGTPSAVTFHLAGAQTLTATLVGDPRVTAQADTTVQPGAPASLRLDTAPISGTAGEALSDLTVTLLDATGNVATEATAPLTLALAINPGSATLSGTLTATPVMGVVTFSGLSLDKAGVGYTLTVSGDGLSAVTSAPFDITTGPVAKLAFGQQPVAAIAGVAIAPAVQVTALDAQDNPVSDATAEVTLTLGTNPGSATLSGTLTATQVNGVATFPDLSLDQAGAGYTLTASATGLAAVTSASFDVVPGQTTRLALALPASAKTGATVTASAQAQDAFGNSTTGYEGTVKVSSSDAKASFPATAAFSEGALTLQGTFGTAGSQTLTLVDTDSASVTGSAQVRVDVEAVVSTPDGGTSSGTETKTAEGCGCSSGDAGAGMPLFALTLVFLGLRKRLFV